PWQLNGDDTSTWIAGASNNIQPGNVLLFVSAPNGIPSTSGPAAVVNVTSVSVDSASANTLIAWDRPLPSALTDLSPAVCLYVFRTKTALFGANAPVPGMFASSTLGSIPGHPSGSGDWDWQYNDGSYVINLDNSYSGLSPAASGANAAANQSQWMVLTGPQYTSFFQIQSASESNPGLYSLSAKTTQLTIFSGTVLSGDAALTLNELLWEFVQETRVTTAYVQSQLLSFVNLPITAQSVNGYALAPGMLAPVSGDSVVLAGLQAIADNSPIGVSGKRLRIATTVALSGSGASAPNGGFTPSGATGALAASLNQAFLVDAFPPRNDSSISGNVLWQVLTVTGQAGMLSVPSGSFSLQPSATVDPPAGEAALVATSQVNGATTTLKLTIALERIYDASTVTVNANAVEATHGETVMEIVGSGDATNPALQFQLKQSPLTYTSAASTSGVQSTLQVRVNNLLWAEVPNFLASAPADRAYVTRPNSSGGPTIQFGDGIQGSRTPTGTSNIQAKYRKGIGVAGMVAAGQLTQPLDRPQGLQSVSNPSAASGGADPATAANARQSAPLPTLTLGRVVSLEDYQNFALSFPGIALALATWTWIGKTRGIFLTVAGEGGTILDASDQVVVNLLSALSTYGLPNVPVIAASYEPQNFQVAMNVKVDTPTYDPDLVLAQVWQNLSAAFAFGQMAPGRSVAASQVLGIAQQTPGVMAVNLTGFNLSGSVAGTGGNFTVSKLRVSREILDIKLPVFRLSNLAAELPTMLCARGPIPPDLSRSGQPAGAQVLLLDPACEGKVEVWP
ncbi:MAG TPA: putative baseplate assembly protein, partial [Terracidiphilus sp.]|nr:putative baseplate assembly protein [Terracidiphilus sp.]